MTLAQQWHEEHKARRLRLGHVELPRPIVRRQLVTSAAPVKEPKRQTIRFVVPPLSAGEYPKIQTCQQVVAQHYKLTVEELLAHKRRPNLVLARHISMYLTCILTDNSLSKIGRNFARDHSTVINAKDRIEAALLEDEELRQTIEHLKTRITGGTSVSQE